ncbi:MAG: amino acid permease [Lactobacillales bacterium]|jgi:glutamate:gamma-aminobutyrate antiporter|nr:amino acid permease [Lactobacillales bacterium]
MKKKLAGKLSLLGFFALTATMVLDVYEYPSFSTSGLNLLFFLVVGGLLWFFPAALCAAEMATVPEWEQGGVFTWVSETWGERFGFAAVFFQWIQITVGFVTMIYFLLSALAKVVDLGIVSTNPLAKTLAVLVIFWLITASQLRGIGFTNRLVNFTFSLGVVLPAILLLVCMVLYLLSGGRFEFTAAQMNLVPDFKNVSMLVVFASFILSYMGVEASAGYVNELDNPKRNYPLAMFLLVIFAVVINAIGGLSIGAVVPLDKLNLSSGVLQAFDSYLAHFHISAGIVLKIIAFLVAFGIFGEISSWVVGPVRGLYMAAQKGLLPPKFRKVNKSNVPIPLVLLQGAIVSIWAIALTMFGGGDNVSFQAALSLMAVIYGLMYLLFLSGYLKYTFGQNKKLTPGYKVPGGKIGQRIIALSGLIVTLFVMFISFQSPAVLKGSEIGEYHIMLIVGTLIVLVLPFIIYALNDKSAHKVKFKPVPRPIESVNPFIKPFARGQHEIISDEQRIKNAVKKLEEKL